MRNLLIVAATIVAAGCGAAGEQDGQVADARPAEASPAPDGVSLGAGAKVLFIHHSTGGVIWNGGVAPVVAAWNSAHGTSYGVTEFSYPHDPYPWENYPYDYWNIWVRNAGPNPFDGQETLETLTAGYDVIVFKHCFPVGDIAPDTGSPNINSSAKTQENYRLQYQALRDKLRSFPARRFIVWTGAALRQSETSQEQATRTKAFFDWVKATWDEPGDNIFLWDFWQLETGGGLYLLPENAEGDSHPNGAFAQRVAPLFARRVVDVIEGRGDSTSLTGE